jgi:hypothetical protein
LLLEFEVLYRLFGKVILDFFPIEGEQWAMPPKDVPRFSREAGPRGFKAFDSKDL